MLYRILLGGTLKGKWVQKSWLIKDSFLEYRGGLLPCGELNRHGRMALWKSRVCALKEFAETEAGRGQFEGNGGIACS